MTGEFDSQGREALQTSADADDFIEACMLGAMLASYDAIVDVVDELVQGGDFRDAANGVVYDAILDIFGRGDHVDLASVVAELSGDGRLEPAGGLESVQRLVSTPYSTQSARAYATSVRDRGGRRALGKLGRNIQDLALSETPSSGEAGFEGLISEVESMVGDLSRRRLFADAPPINELLQPAMDELDMIAMGRSGRTRVPTGLTDLDALLEVSGDPN